MILHKNPKAILAVGSRACQIAGKFLFYEINRLDCVVREKRIIPIINKYFDSNWLNDPRINIFTDDERNFIANIKSQYDIISLEIENMYHPYRGYFYSIDFYKLCKQKLLKNGLVIQHIPVFYTSTGEFKSIVNSFISVFPKSILWYNGPDLLLIGSLEVQPGISQNRIDLIDNDIHINIDFSYTYWGGPRHWLTHDDMFLTGFLLSSDKLKNFVKNSPLIRDDLPLMKCNYTNNNENRLYLEFIKENLEPTENIYNGELSDLTRDFIKYMRILNINDIYTRQLIKEYEHTKEIKFLNRAYSNNPKNYKVNYLLGVDWNNYGHFEYAIKYFSQSIAINPNVEKVHNVLAMLYHQVGNFTKALYHYHEALRINPSYYPAHNNIGVLLENQGSYKEAIDHFEQALQIKPDFKNSQINLKRIKDKFPFLKTYSEK
jgi:tetratricopeptide (TPR) repeat protein